MSGHLVCGFLFLLYQLYKRIEILHGLWSEKHCVVVNGGHISH